MLEGKRGEENEWKMLAYIYGTPAIVRYTQYLQYIDYNVIEIFPWIFDYLPFL
jgi:hypothetical protein